MRARGVEAYDGTRMRAQMCYRSREEIDERFAWVPDETGVFEIEKYLQHQGNKFSRQYDPNCYLTLSLCMDLMNLGTPFAC